MFKKKHNNSINENIDTELVNIFYDIWLENSSDELKKEISEINLKQKNKLFGFPLKFCLNGIKTNLGIGISNFNSVSFGAMISLLKTELQKISNNIYIFTNNKDNDKTIELISNILNENKFNVFSSDNFLSTQPFLSFLLSKKNDGFGIYVDQIEDDIIIKFFNKNGEEFDEKQYSTLNKKLDYNHTNLNFKILAPSEIKKIPSSFFEEYKNQFYIKHFSNSLINNFLVLTHSDAVEDLFNEIKTNHKVPLEIIRDSSNSRNDSLDAKSFSTAYKHVKKTQFEKILNINSQGNKISLAIKEGKVWRFMNSLEMLFLYYILFDKKIKLNSTLTSPKFLENFSSENSDSEIYFGDNFDHKLKNALYNDAITNALFIIETLLNKEINISQKLNSIKQEKGYVFFTSTTKHIDEKKFNEFISNLKHYKKMSNIDILKIKSLVESEEKNIYSFITTSGEVFLVYDKLSNNLLINYYTFEQTYEASHYYKLEIEKTTENFVLNKIDSNTIDSKKGILKTMLFFSVFITAMFLVLGFQYESGSISNSFNIFFNSMNFYEPYLLMMYLIIYPLIVSAAFYIVIKSFKDDSRFIDIFKGCTIYVFFWCLVPILVIDIIALYWYLKKKNYKMSQLVPTTSVLVLIFAVVTFSFNLSMIIYGNNYLINIEALYYDPVLYWTAVGGLIWFTFNFSYLFIFAYSVYVQRWLFSLMEKVLFRFKKENQYGKMYDSLIFNIYNTKLNTNLALKNFSACFWTVLIILGGKIYSLTAFYSSINLVLINITTNYGLGVWRIPNFWGISSVSVMISSASGMLPIPGGMGIYEYFMNSFLNGIFVSALNVIDEQLVLNISDEEILSVANQLSSQATFMYRMFTYYGLTLFTMIPYVVKIFKIKITNIRTSSKTIWQH